MAECIFCEIAAGRAEARVVYEDDLVVAFEDVQPQAPVHAPVIPRSHLADARQVSEDGDGVLERLFEAAHVVARGQGVGDSGYRLVFNVGPDAGQAVDHAHLHVIGGRGLRWPPG
jgi:histidine triad (HIT) family protein